MGQSNIPFFQVLTSLIVGLLAAYIAYQQWKTNHLKLKHDLYERRLVVYDSLMEFLADVVRLGNCNLKTLLEFNRRTRESRFLFGKDVSEYLQRVYENGVDLHTAEEQFAALPQGEEKIAVIKKRTEKTKWLSDQFIEAPDLFEKYLRLS